MTPEEVTCIYHNSAGKAWIEAVSYILDNGRTVEDVVEVCGLLIVVNDGSKDDEIYKKYVDKKMVAWMTKQNFGSSTPIHDWGYSYGQRLKNFNGVNQLNEVYKKLSSNCYAKSATIAFEDPAVDFAGHMPCINVIDFKIRNNKLNIYCFFRSQDIGKKMCADIKAISIIQDVAAKKLKVQAGTITNFIASAHIYNEDISHLNNVLRELGEG